jgi:uncharacterized protein
MAGRLPDEAVRCPLLHQQWRHVAFLHWAYEPSALQTLLPDWLTLDLYDGTAWLSLTPFLARKSRLPFVPAVPGFSDFPETNLRTYVVGPDGRDGLWFFTLEAGSLTTVRLARSLLGVPYRWAAMDVRAEAGQVSYTSRRRARGSLVGHRIVIQPGARLSGDAQLAAWLTGRWRAWTRVAGQAVTIPVEHEPWPLVDGELVDLEENVVASHVPPPAGPPVVHYASGVNARLGWPQGHR